MSVLRFVLASATAAEPDGPTASFVFLVLLAGLVDAALVPRRQLDDPLGRQAGLSSRPRSSSASSSAPNSRATLVSHSHSRNAITPASAP